MCASVRFVILILSLSFLSDQSVFAQCPLDLGEVTIPTTNNLQLHFPFDGNVNNLGNSNYSATASGASFVPAHCGQGLSFDGVDDFVEVTPSLDLSNSYTITAWIQPNTQNNPMGIFSTRAQCASTYRGQSTGEFGIGNYGVAPLSWQINTHQNCTGFSGGDRYTDAGINIPNNSETFVAVTVLNNSSENRVVQLYVNCEEFTTSMTLDWQTGICFVNPLNYVTTIGAFSNIPGFYNSFDGIIDEVRLYDAVLNAEEILDIYHSCLPPSIDVVNDSDCLADSAVITLNNTELDVEYQLFDITNGVYVGAAQPGDCNSLVFVTGAVNTTTQFQLEAVNTVSNCAIWMDSIITLDPSAQQYVGAQNVQLCSGDSLQINNQFVSTAGIYIDTIPFSSFCDSIITYTVSLIDLPQPDLGPDIEICENQSVTLNSTTIGGSNLWQDGTTGNSIIVSQPGVYWVAVTNQCGTIADTVIVGLTDIGLDLGEDTTFCEGESLLLQANFPPSEVTWQDGSIGNTYSVNSQGIYIATVTQSNCTVSDTVMVTLIDTPPSLFDGDTTICDGTNFLLFAGNSGSFSWNNGSSENAIVVNGPGLYSVTAANECGSSYSELIVLTEECFCQLFIPNAFTPTGDEKNNDFFAVFDCPLESFEMLIFNRWGQVVFESNDINDHWDGTFNGRSSQDGLYTYKVTYSDEIEVDKIVTGHINLLR